MQSKKEKAFRVVKTEEGLFPYSHACACKVFHEGNDLTEEYLGFDLTDETDCAAQTICLQGEMDRL